MTTYRATIVSGDPTDADATAPVVVEFVGVRSARHQQVTMDEFTGGHLLHLAVAGCVFNDVWREAGARGITLTRVAVTAHGDFTTEPFVSTGIEYSIDLEGDADRTVLDELVAHVDAIAEIPEALRRGMDVRRTSS